jgi:hypothetical protein
VSLVIALIAIAVAVAAWFRPANSEPPPPAPDSTPKYSDQQIADAKKAVCAAHDLVGRATEYSGSQKNDDPTLKYIIAVNNRLAGALSGDYFLAQLNHYPATPHDLSAATQDLALAYQGTTLMQLANASADELDTIYKTLDTADAKVVEACK